MSELSSLQTFAWLSHERPEALRRSITSFIKGCGERANSYRYIVAESGAFQTYPDYIPAKNLLYVNDAYREGLIQYLEKGLRDLGGRADVVRFALSAKQPEGSEGVHRNTIALLTQGDIFACADDDIIFDIQALPQRAKIQTRAGESNFIPFKSFAELDAFQGHPVSLGSFIASHENALQSVTFSSPGIRGDSAFGGPRFIFTFDDSSLTAFCKNPNFVGDALGSRVMWRETAQSHMSSYASLATYMLGINNRQGLAPCFPFGRNLDGAFIYATKALHLSTKTAQLSLSVSHRPIIDRGSYASLNALDFRINDLIWLMWSEWLESTSPAVPVVERYAAAALYFQNIGARTLTSFRDYLKQLGLRTLSDRANKLERQIERLRGKDNTPGLLSWIYIAEKEVQLCRQMAFADTLPLPEESRVQGRSLEDRLQLTQRWIKQYGDLIESWPTMCGLMLKEEYYNNFQNSQTSN